MNINLNSLSLSSVATEAISAQVRAIQALATRIDKSFDIIVEILINSKGRLVISGMGKSGLIGKKIAATLASTGTPSFFLHPAEALHGDLGMICPDDVVMLISNSGETDEVLRMLPALKYFGNTVIAMAGNSNSTLARSAEYCLDISVEREVCPLNLAPTTSTLVTMAMGDVLAVTLMTVRGFEPKDFARFHPGGNLGRQLLTQVSDVMNRDIPAITAESNLRQAMLKMTEGRLGVAVVLEDKQLIGIITDGDLRRIFSQENAGLDDPVQNYISSSPIIIKSNAMLFEAEQVMLDKKVKCLIVVDDGEVVGLMDIFDR